MWLYREPSLVCCRMKDLSIILLLFLPAIGLALLADPKWTPERAQIEEQISKLRKYLERNEGLGSNLGLQWAQLGYLYQTSDISWHDGGGYRPLALECFNKALKYTLPSNEEFMLLQRKGILLKMMGRGPEAVSTYRAALDVPSASPTDLSAIMMHLADAQNMMGMLEEAYDSLNRSLQMDSNNLEAYYQLVQVCKEKLCWEGRDGWLELVSRMEQALQKVLNNSASTSQENKASLANTAYEDDEDVYADYYYEDSSLTPSSSPAVPPSRSIHWALFEACHKADDRVAAWKHLSTAHSMEITSRGFQADQAVDQMIEMAEQVQSVFHEGFWPPGVGSTSRVPVFIIGMMRSGSTLLETILDAHPQVFGLGEDSVFNGNLHEVRNAVVEASISGAVGEAVSTNAKILLKKMAAQATDLGLPKGQKVKRLVDKMLFNYRNLGFIHLLFPEATLLHTVRDPMDTLLSCFTHKFDDKGLEWAFDMDALVEQYAQYLALMAHFRKVLPPERIVDVNYEDLVWNPEPSVRILIVEKLGLEWNSSVMDFHLTNRSVHTHSMQQVRRGIYTNSIGKWTQYAEQLKPIRKRLLPITRRMLKRNELPFADSINWLLDPKFPYGNLSAAKQQTRQSKTSPVTPSPTEPPLLSEEPIGVEELEVVAEGTVTAKGKRQRVVKLEAKPKLNANVKATPIPKVKSQAKAKPKAKPKAKVKAKPKAKVKAKAIAKVKAKPEEVIGRSNKRSVGATIKFPDSQNKDKEWGGVKKVTMAPENIQISNKKKDGLMFNNEKKRQLMMLVEELEESLSPEIVQYIPTVRKALPYPSGDTFCDEVSALGVLLFNLGRLGDAIRVFEPLIQYRTGLYSAYVGVASAYAMDNQLEKSLGMMDRLLEELRDEGVSVSHDVYERRAQVVMAMGDLRNGIEDLTRAIAITPTPTAFMARGTAYMKDQKFLKAKEDLLRAVTMGVDSVELWNMLGRCEKEFGEPDRAIAAHKKALQKDPSNNEALLDMAIVYMSISDAANAMKFINKALQADPTVKNVHGYKGLMQQNSGLSRKCIEAFAEVHRLDPTDTQALQFTAICYQGMGDYQSAIKWFDKTLDVDPEHYSWSLREIAYYRWKNLDTPLNEYNPDTDIHWLIKDGWIRRDPLKNYCARGVDPYCHHELKLHNPGEQATLAETTAGVNTPHFYSEDRKRQFQDLVNITGNTSRWIQVDSPGFLRHQRQHRMFGVMVLQMAQELMTHISLLRNGKEGLQVPNAARSRRVLVGKQKRDTSEDELDVPSPSEGRGGPGTQTHSDDRTFARGSIAGPIDPLGSHSFSWRDLYDIAVKWRQLGEPFDTVLWIDCTAAQEDKHDKVGLQTFIHHGVGKNIRYYPYFSKIFSLMKKLLPDGYYIGADDFEYVTPTAETIEKINRATSLRELLDAVPSLYVLTPLNGSVTAHHGPLEGTRIALSHGNPEGEDLYISTGTQEERYDRYYQEMEGAFNRIVHFHVQHNMQNYNVNQSGLRDEAVKLCLELYFYWINFSPLSRGSAAVGYASVVACMMIFGEVPARPLPKGVQLDWEAILSSHPRQFADLAFPWLQDRIPLQGILPECFIEVNDDCRVTNIVSTARDAIYTINALYEDL